MAIDKEQLKSIYQDHHQALYNFALRWVFDFSQAEELVHEAYLALWEKRDKIEAVTAKSYLFKSIQNRSINLMRRQKFLGFLGVEFVPEIECPDGSAESQFMNQQEILKIKKILEQLPLNYRKVILLSYYGNFSQKEIAEQLQIAEGTVASRKNRAMDILKANFNLGSEYAI